MRVLSRDVDLAFAFLVPTNARDLTLIIDLQLFCDVYAPGHVLESMCVG